MLRLPRLIAAAVVAGTSFLAPTAHAQQVCDAASLGGGEACFYAGPSFTGPEFDLSIPLTRQLPVPTDGDCTDLPTGIGLDGSVTNVSGDTLYVFPSSCPDSAPGTQPGAIVMPHFSGNIVTPAAAQHGTHSIRMCGTGLVLNPITLTCAFGR
ncbi:MAG TPA: hypothetical protein VEO01_11345 [Pseudonocardiaceae bacterium]|nr:hypothetical protein [Pseudonocardiaceae bacterium]